MIRVKLRSIIDEIIRSILRPVSTEAGTSVTRLEEDGVTTRIYEDGATIRKTEGV
jgi:hypothetical protein